MTFRTGRIWRLGEKELVVRKYNVPKRIQLRDAREDDLNIDPDRVVHRASLGVAAFQLTSAAWHEYCWRL